MSLLRETYYALRRGFLRKKWKCFGRKYIQRFFSVKLDELNKVILIRIPDFKKSLIFKRGFECTNIYISEQKCENIFQHLLVKIPDEVLEDYFDFGQSKKFGKVEIDDRVEKRWKRKAEDKRRKRLDEAGLTEKKKKKRR